MIKILIAEDSGVIRKLLTQLLEKEKDLSIAGYAVDGVEACKQNVLLQPDIILMDIRMPKLNGLESVKQIMTERPCPIIMITSVEPSAEVRAESLKYGAISFFSKPAGLDYGVIANKLISEIRAFSKLK